MKIDELISLLQEVRGVHGSHLRVVIPVYQEFSIGSTPCVDIDSVYRGIDWDNGKVFICPEDKLEAVGYKPEDVRLSCNLVVHEPSCATLESALSHWIRVSPEELRSYVFSKNLNVYAHTIADTIGYHVSDPDSAMLAKVYIGHDGKEYYIWSKTPVGEKHECNCERTNQGV